MRSLSRIALSVSLVALMTGADPAASQDVAKWRESSAIDLLPRTANAISIVRVEQLMNSPRAQAEDYAETAQKLYEAGEAVIPPWVKSAAIASLFRPSQEGPAFRAMVAELAADAPVEPVGGQAGEIFGKAPILKTERDAIFVGKAGGRVVGWSPSSRSELGHWLKGAFAQGLSPALRAVVDNQTAEVILGLELVDLVSEASARTRLSSDPTFDGRIDRGVQLLTTAVSIGCAVDVTSRLDCAVTVRGDGSILISDDDAALVKDIFLAVLADTGYSLPEFRSFSAVADGPNVIMTGQLEDDSLGALMSLGVPPLASGRSLMAMSSQKPTSGDSSRTRRDAIRSDPLKEFERATTMLDALERRQQRATNPASVASWCDRTAGEMDDLSTETDDTAVAGFASRTATRLRAMGSSLRGLSTDLNAEQQTLTYNVRRTAGWASVNVWGGVGYRDPTVNVDSNLREVRKRQAKIVQDSASEREGLWAMIQEDRADTKRALLEVQGR